MTGFYRRLLQQAHRDDPVGDRARDVAQDPDWPSRARRLSRMEAYLLRAWGEWPR